MLISSGNKSELLDHQHDTVLLLREYHTKSVKLQWNDP
jgi:hypothetical protein